MALAKTSNGIVGIRGRYGGVYFKKDNTGQHIQAMPRSIRKASMQEPKSHNNLSSTRADNISGLSMAAAWWIFLIIGLALSAIWGKFSDQHPFMFEDKPPGRLPPYHWFMHFNIMRAARKKPPRIYPPNSPTDLPVAETTSGYDPLNYANWYETGTYNGKKLYKSQDGNWYNWWFDPSWIISNAPGQSEEPPYWFRVNESEFGDYVPVEPVYETTGFVSDD